MLYIALAAIAGLIGLDQLTKILIDSNMELHQSIPIISFGDTNVLNITYERNPGAAFSILEGKQLFLILFTAVVIVVMLYLMLSKRVKKPTYIWSMSLIVAGGIGNLIDRVIRGEVVDFIDMRRSRSAWITAFCCSRRDKRAEEQTLGKEKYSSRGNREINKRR